MLKNDSEKLGLLAAYSALSLAISASLLALSGNLVLSKRAASLLACKVAYRSAVGFASLKEAKGLLARLPSIAPPYAPLKPAISSGVTMLCLSAVEAAS